MKKILKISVFSLFTLTLICFLSSCFKDKEVFEEYPNDPWGKQQKIELDVSGEIIDEAGQPVDNVQITANNKTAITDKNGVFVIKKSLQNPDFIYVKAEKKGFFNGAKAIRGTKNGVNFVKVVLLKQVKIATLKANVGGEVKAGKMKIKFPANGYIDAQGKTFNGNVNVAARYLDPTKPETIFEMPGDLRAVNFQGEEKILESYGMVAVALTDDSGNKLNLGNGGEAEMSFPKPTNATAHAKIPLWHFDEKVGAWREDGSSELINGEYVGKVKHFSWWNCDFPYDRVFAKGRIIDQNGNPLAGVWVGLDLVGQPWGGHGHTDANGVFMGSIPKGMDLELKVGGVGNSCYQIIFSKNVGSFTSDVDFKDIVVTFPTSGPPIKTFSGTVVDCNNQKLKNGYVVVYLKESKQRVNLVTDSSGNFKYTITPSNCQPDITGIELFAYDLTAKKESSVKTFTLNAGNNDLGNIEVCTSITTFIDLKLGDSTFYSVLPTAEITMSKDSLQQNDVLGLYLSGQDTQKYAVFAINVNSNPPINGTYPAILRVNNGLAYSNLVLVKDQNLMITLTEVSLASGGYVAGTMSGSITKNGQIVPASGSFRVRKF